MVSVEQVVEWAIAYSDELERLVRLLVAVVGVYALARLLVEPGVGRIVRRSNPGNPTLQRAVMRHLRLGIVLLALAAGIVAAGYGDVLAGSNLVIAAATLAIGVAGQEVIGSIISGLFLVANSEFNTGDWIQWDDREGEILSIHFRTTRVRTDTNEVVTVPNTELTANAIVHRYGRDRLRLTEEVTVAYDADVRDAIERLEETAATTEPILSAPRPRAHLLELGDDEVVLRLEFWVDDPTRRSVLGTRSALALSILRAFNAADVELSPPSDRRLEGHVDVTVDDRKRGDDGDSVR